MPGAVIEVGAESVSRGLAVVGAGGDIGIAILVQVADLRVRELRAGGQVDWRPESSAAVVQKNVGSGGAGNKQVGFTVLVKVGNPHHAAAGHRVGLGGEACLRQRDRRTGEQQSKKFREVAQGKPPEVLLFCY